MCRQRANIWTKVKVGSAQGTGSIKSRDILFCCVSLCITAPNVGTNCPVHTGTYFRKTSEEVAL